MTQKIQMEISQTNVEDLQNLNQKKNEHSIGYRPDVDGMRAIAIIIIVLFHAWPFLIRGGFIGVDIFFVISGYLITQIIIKQHNQNKSIYGNFYNRRIKRIFPALLILLMFVLVVGVYKLPLRHLVISAQTCIASSYFGANIFLMRYERNYFDPDAKYNPLLHLWSLGIEEQFYIFWPFLITFIIKKSHQKMFHILFIFTLLSFIVNILSSIINPKFDFYFPFCRFWEMAIGGLLGVRPFQLVTKISADRLSQIGTVMILISAFLLSEKSTYPGWWCLLPTLGCAFIIQAGSQSYINKKILATKGMVFIGKISYSLYLWHWPLLNMFRIMYPEGSSSIFAYTVTILIMSFGLSVISFYLIENPIRYSKKKFTSLVLILLMIFVFFSARYVLNNSYVIFKSRLDESIEKQIELDMIPSQQDYFIKNGKKHPNSSKNKIRSPGNATKIKYSFDKNQIFWLPKLLDKKIDKSSKFYRQNIPRFIQHYQVSNEGQQNLFLFVSDSYGNVGARFQKLYEDAVQQNRTSQFPTVVSMVAPGINLKQTTMRNFVMEWIQLFKPKRVLFIYKMDYYFVDPQLHKIVRQFSDIIKNLVQKGVQVAISTLRPRGRQYDPANMFDNNGIIEQNVKPGYLGWWQQYLSKTIELFQRQMSIAGAEIINYCDNQCWEGTCEVLSPRGVNLFSDQSHYTHLYSRYWMSAADHLVEF